MSSPYELIGRQAEQIANLHGALATAVAVLRGVKEGAISLDRLTVNEDGTVSVAAIEPTPIGGATKRLPVGSTGELRGSPRPIDELSEAR